MSLQFILGRAGSGKSTYCIEQAAKSEECGKRVIIIVPEQYSHQGESALLEKKGYMHDDFTVTSFGRLAKKLIATSCMPYAPLDSAGKAMLTLKAMMNCRQNLTYYGNCAEKSGYLSLFMDMISELKKGQVLAEELHEAARSTDNALFSARLLDLAHIYEAYNLLLTDEICDSDDDLTRMAELIPQSDYIKGATIYIDAFYRFTQNELSVIRAFLACGADVCVSLCMPKDSVSDASIFAGVNRSYQAILRLANETNTPVLPPVIMPDAPRFSSRELRILERTLAGEHLVCTEPVQDVSLYVAGGKYEEVSRTACAIRRYVAETGTPYRDIAVITGDYDGYADLVSSVFPLYDIPVFADIRHDFLSHPIVLYLFSLFDLLTGITTKSVITYMKSGFAGIAPDDAARLENFALASAIEYGDWLQDERFLYKIQSVFDAQEPSMTETDYVALKTNLLAPILVLKEQMMASKRVKDRIDALITFLENQKLAEKIDRMIQTFQENGLHRQAEEFADVYNILMETLDQMAHTLGEENIGISAMRSMLEAGLSQKSIGVIPTVYDQVSFGDLNRSVIKNVRALFVLGVNNGMFPPLPQAGILLSDTEREFLNGRGIHVAPDTKQLIADAEFSVYTATTVAREKLYISYSLTDSEGHGVRPATFLSVLKRVFPNLSPEHEENKEELSADTIVASMQSAYFYLLTHMHLLGKSETVDRLYDTLYENPLYREKLLRAKEYSSFENKATRLSQESVKALYGDTLQGSVSRFERFSSCPFSFFLEYGLKAKERKILKVEAPDIGSLLHEIIEQFSHRLHGTGKTFRTVTQEEQNAITDSIMDEMFGAMHIKDIYGDGRLKSLKNRMKSLVSKSIWALCVHVKKGAFEPTDFEVGFGQNETFPPVTVPLPDGGKVVLSGRIDRIDTFTHEGNLYIKIIDYKSGAKKYSLSDIFNGTTLQLAVYMLAASQGMESTSSSPVKFGGMLYFHLDDPVQQGTPADGADELAVLKTYKMSGLVSDNPAVIRAMDADFTQTSPVIPVYMNKEGFPSDSWSKLASDERVQKLNRHILKTVEQIGKEIMQGTVDISPIRDGKITPCSYCKYRPVCDFDPHIHPCRKPQKFSSDAEIWDTLE